MAHMLARVGECYNRIGLRDHAAIPLRAAVKIFRKYPEDPRLSAALITLGTRCAKALLPKLNLATARSPIGISRGGSSCLQPPPGETLGFSAPSRVATPRRWSTSTKSER